MTTAHDAAELGQLRDRVQALEDERAILAAMYRYGHALDYGLEAEWVDCFVADAHYEIRDQPAEPSPARCFDGHVALAAFAATHTRWPEHRHKHVVVDPVVQVDGDRAGVVSYFVRIDEADGDRVVYAFGRYLDELTRCADGRWRFARRVAEVEARRARPAARRG